MSYEYKEEDLNNQTIISNQYVNDKHKGGLKTKKVEDNIIELIDLIFNEKILENRHKALSQFKEIIVKYDEIPDDLSVLWNQKKKLLEYKSKDFIYFLFQQINSIIESKSIKHTSSTIDSPQISTFKNDIQKENTQSIELLQYEKYELENDNQNNEEYNKSSISKNQINALFFPEEECEGTNIIYTDKKDLFYISFNLLLEKIALDPTFDNNNSLKEGLILQYSNFISTQMLIDKVLNTFYYFLNIHNNGDSTKKDSFDSASTIASSSGVNYLPKGIIYFMNMIIIEKYEKEISQYSYMKQKIKSFYSLLSENPLFKTNEEYRLDDIMKLLNIPSENHYDLYLGVTQLKPRKRFDFIRSAKYKERNDTIHKGLFHIEDWTAKDIALQLTYISSSMMNKIEVHELLFGNCVGKDKQAKSPNIMKVIERFNKLTFFIIEEILSYDKKRKRAEIIGKFIDIAYELKLLHNYNDSMNIKASLNHFIIKSLNKTWQYVNPEHKKILGKLNDLLSIHKSFSNLKQKIAKNISSSKYYIPYLGMILQELSFLEEGNKYVHKEHMMINASKINNVKKIIDDFFQYRNRLQLIPNTKGLEILSELNPKKESELDDDSKTLEPIFIRAKKKEINKRMTNTDIFIHKSNLNLEMLGCISVTKSGVLRIDPNFYE